MNPSPIQFAPSFQTSDGKCYATLEEAQEVAVAQLLGDLTAEDGEKVAKTIVENKDGILAILTLNPKSRPRARGSKKPRAVRGTAHLALKAVESNP